MPLKEYSEKQKHCRKRPENDAVGMEPTEQRKQYATE